MESVLPHKGRDHAPKSGTQSAVEEDQARLSAALSIARLGTFEWNVLTDAVALDERSREIFGFAPGEEITAQEVFNRIHPGDLARVREEARRSREQLSRLETEYRIILPDGAVRNIASVNIAIAGPEGKAERMFGVFGDITERKQAESVLRENEQRLRCALEIDTVGVIFFDLEGNITDANDAFLRMSGFTRADLAAAPLRWDALTPPEWMSISLDRRDQLARTGIATPYEKEYFRKDGSRWWGLFAPRMLNECEAVEFILDITERKHTEEALRESENQFRLAFAGAPVGLVLTDLVGNLLHVNGAYCELLGYTAEELHNRNFLTLTYEEDVPRNRDLYTQLLSGAVPSFTIEKRYRRRNGQLIWVRATATVIGNDAARPAQVVGIVENIQTRKEAETALLRSREELAQFAHTVAHDLQTPLRTVRSYSELLARDHTGKLDDRADQFLKFIIDGAQSMEQLIRALLRYAEVGEDGTDRTPVSLSTVVDAVRALMKAEIEQTAAQLVYSPLPTVTADRLQLTQLFQNLIGNAIKYRRADEPPRITISAESGRYGCLVSVEDNGQGIEPQFRERIFQPLKRLHGAEIPGTGIGLAICKKIVERQGGRIWVDSEPGRGSKFYFTLPCV